MREDAVGDKVDQYELTELLARSGMASIFTAVDTGSRATVVLTPKQKSRMYMVMEHCVGEI